MPTTLYYANQYFTTTLSVAGGINASQTTGIVLADISGLDATKPSIALLEYADPLGANREWITYTSINEATKELQGVTRGAEGDGGIGKTHANGVAVAFPISASHINNLQTAYEELQASQTSVTSSSSVTPTGDHRNNELFITALAEATTINGPSGTPANGNKLIIRIKDNGTARALTYNAIYLGIVDTLPSTTTTSKVLYMGFIYNSTSSKWEMVAKVEES